MRRMSLNVGFGARGFSSRATEFFESTKIKAVVGTSTDREKFGNKVLRCYVTHMYNVVPINNKSPTIENINAVPNIEELQQLVEERTAFPGVSKMSEVGLSIVTPPLVTRVILEQAVTFGVRYFFLQPGTADSIVRDYVESNMKDCIVIEGCVLRELGC